MWREGLEYETQKGRFCLPEHIAKTNPDRVQKVISWKHLLPQAPITSSKIHNVATTQLKCNKKPSLPQKSP